MIKRLSTALLLAGTLALSVSATALGSHVHVRELGNGECVILASAGGEKHVTLPNSVFDRNPNISPGSYAPDKQHPLHVLVHLAGAGSGKVHVYGSPSDTCTRYVNG